ncbi:hypothetical protein KPL71_005389 [Citrus sinensis]|uniref:Uncharacterized protein n=1 Tax=Citrus sinensis TaxID=2711 RepID=A0ACB8NCZ8_CITSI|nr:hypothetical protein KPL71_005389 [Citrus sinensis]
MSKANTVIPKPIQWKDITLPDEWILEGATQLVIPRQLEPNTELQNVTQYSDSKVKLSFRRSTSSRFSDKDSSSSIPHLQKKFSKVPSVINLPFQPTNSQPKFSTSDIPSSSIHSVDYATSVPHPIYTSRQSQEEKEPSPPTSLTFSAVTENIINFEMYASDNNINYPFKESNLIMVRKKIVELNISGSGRTIESEHPPLRSLTIEHGEPPVEIKASPYKIHKDPDTDLDSIIQQNNFSSSSASTSKVQIAPDSAQSSKIGVLEQDQSSIVSYDIEAFKDESIPKANKIHWELALPTMTMAANAYKTQQGTSDKAIAEILIAGFTGQLKGWWDHLLTQQQQLDILNSIQVDENGAPILDEFNSPIQDAVATLILTISLHFIGDPSHLRDKNAELLHNLICMKLSEFQSYKITFFTRLFFRDDANHVTWKENFLAGLPTLLGEKVRNSIKALYDNQIPYDELTYGELVSFVNKEGLKICQDLKLKKRLKWELRKSKQELDNFYVTPTNNSIIAAVESADLKNTTSQNMNKANTNNKREGVVVESGADRAVNWQNARCEAEILFASVVRAATLSTRGLLEGRHVGGSAAED